MSKNFALIKIECYLGGCWITYLIMG